MYTTTADLKRNLGQHAELLLTGLVTPARPGYPEDDSVLISIIADASDFIDGMIVQAVTVPVTPTPKLLASICNFICVKNIWALKNTKDIPAHVQKDYDNAIKLLGSIASGKLKLSAADPADSSFHDLKFTTKSRIFGTDL
jgi:phage gp36-like protein